ncbi:MAG TPA: ABC transporter permease [Bryobacteraceae bacterium]|jgi:predicted permease|nr:ABC transporter permease [Bryobacteraceae bacterium]
MNWSRFFRRRHWDRERAAEVEQYIEIETADNLARGMPAAQARAAARRKLGNPAIIREEIYRMNTIGFMETLGRDLRYTMRVLRKSPGYAVVAVLSLALGIGANTAIFSLVDQVMLRMLPVRDPARLVVLHRDDNLDGTSVNDNYESVLSYPMYRRLRDDSRAFSGVIARAGTAVTILYNGNAESVGAELVSGNFFNVLGVRAAAGRLFTSADDDAPMAHPVVVLSHSYWVKRFAASPTIVNQTVHLNGFPMTVVGVSAAGFNGVFPGNMPDIYVPVTMLGAAKPTWKALDEPSFRWLNILARTAPGVPIETAQAAANVAYRAALEAELARPGFHPRDSGAKAYRAASLELRAAGQGINELRRNNQGPLLALSAMVGLVLLIACANVASLTIARATARQRELQVRLAIGARRWDLVRQLLVEGLTLALAGGALGLLVADWTTRALLRTLPQDLAGDWVTAGLNPWLLAFTFAIALLSGLFFSLMPALQATRPDLAGALRCGAATAAPAGSVWLRKCIVTSQVALSLVLVVAAGLFGSTLFHLARTNLGFRPQNLLVFKVDASRSRPHLADAVAYYRDLLQRIAAVPGVTGVGAAAGGPFSNWGSSGNITLEGYQPRKGEDLDVNETAIAPGFFAALDIPLRAGREFSERDGATPKVVVVNEAFAKRYASGRNPVGLRLMFGGGSHPVLDREIVGVVADIRGKSREAAHETIYYPISQWDSPERMMFYVRSAGDPGALGPSMRAAVRTADANVPLWEMSPITLRIADSIYVERLLAMLSIAFGVLATLLAALGLYGIVAFTVARRTAEIGLRMALGAQPGDMLRMVVLEAARLALVGIAIGSAVALAVSRLVESQLFGVEAANPVILTCAAALLALVALGAAMMPGVRAARINPVAALKYE